MFYVNAHWIDLQPSTSRALPSLSPAPLPCHLRPLTYDDRGLPSVDTAPNDGVLLAMEVVTASEGLADADRLGGSAADVATGTS